mgnify:CR=1 FL=1
MKLPRLPYETGAVLDFYEDGLTALGALCARPWHDRLDVVAEGRAATLWNSAGALHAAELQVTAPDAAGMRDAAREEVERMLAERSTCKIFWLFQSVQLQ